MTSHAAQHVSGVTPRAISREMVELLFSCGTAYIGGYTEGYLPREGGITPDRVKQHASGVLRENRSTGRQKILGGGGGGCRVAYG